MSTRRTTLLRAGLLTLAAALAAAGCGGSNRPAATTASSVGAATATTPTTAAGTTSKTTAATTSGGTGAATTSSGSALVAEANSAAAGDIPDNQVFLTYHNGQEGYSIRFPEGWARRGNGGDVTFQDKNNLVHILIQAGSLPTLDAVKGELASLQTSTPSLRAGQPSQVTISGAPAIKVVYTTQSTPNDVTGKRVTLTVDRYYLANGGKVAVVDLGTPKGVDNVDAYRMMIESFKWK